MGILSALFGGSKEKSTSDNRAFGQINQQFSPAVGAGVGGIQRMGNALSGGFDDYLDQSGFDFALGEGFKDITGAGAAKGLLRSGGTSKALAGFADGLKRRSYDNYLGAEANLGQLGLGAGGLITSAGQRNQSSGKSQNGILSTLFSDRSVKQDIVKHGQLAPGLFLYSFRYIGLDLPIQMGFMADEVRKFCPEAVSRGFYAPLAREVDVVNYAKVLEEVRNLTTTEAV